DHQTSFAPGRHISGGVIRDHQGRELAAFSANLGSCSIMRAELRAAEIGLTKAWELGAKKVILELDSLVAVNAIEGFPLWDSRHGPILTRSIFCGPKIGRLQSDTAIGKPTKWPTSSPTWAIVSCWEFTPFFLCLHLFGELFLVILREPLSPARFQF
ncbi:hypothetical protein LINPERHAP2_LOCUS40166, partial [Linum perenne]